MSLTRAEKLAGRHFRDAQQAILAALWESDPDPASTSPFLRHYRHDCAARRHSWSLELSEAYALSPELWVCYCSMVGPNETVPHDDCDGGVKVPAGRFGFIYLEGTCPDCGLRVRSGMGRFMDAYTRPPREKKIYA
jgi:hypothetical protein